MAVGTAAPCLPRHTLQAFTQLLHRVAPRLHELQVAPHSDTQSAGRVSSLHSLRSPSIDYPRSAHTESELSRGSSNCRVMCPELRVFGKTSDFVGQGVGVRVKLTRLAKEKITNHIASIIVRHSHTCKPSAHLQECELICTPVRCDIRSLDPTWNVLGVAERSYNGGPTPRQPCQPPNAYLPSNTSLFSAGRMRVPRGCTDTLQSRVS